MPPADVLVLEAFFRIHFAAEPGILEDLLAKMHKIQKNAPLPSKIKEILSDSGPAIYLLNRLIDPQFHYIPDVSVSERTQEVDDIFQGLKLVSCKYNDDVDFLAMTSAIAAFHRHETNYIKIFDYIIANSPDTESSRYLIKLLDKKALHKSCPCIQADDQDDGDFSLDDMDDVDKDVQPRIRYNETLEEVIAKAEAHSDDCLMALYLAACGTLTRNDLLLKAPEFINTNIKEDPVAIGPHDFVTQSLKNGVEKPDYSLEKYYPRSYRKAPKVIRDQKVTGSGMHDEFIENREYVCLCFDPGAEKHVDHDKAIAIAYLMGAAEILHDQDVPITKMIKTLTEIKTGYIHPGIVDSLRDVYDFQCDEIYEALKKTPLAIPIVGETMTKALYKMEKEYFESYDSVFVRLTAGAVRTFPHAEYIPECMEYVKQKIIPEGMHNVERLEKLLQPAMKAVNEQRTVKWEVTDAESLLLNRFSKFYKQYIRKHHPFEFMKPPVQYFAYGLEWPVAYEHIIEEAVKEYGIPEFDEDCVKYPTPVLNDLMVKTLEELAKVEDPPDSPTEDAEYIIGEENCLDIKLTRRHSN